MWESNLLTIKNKNRMVIGKIRPTATIVAQFAAGVEVEAIQHEGKMYLPIVGMGEFSTKEEVPARPDAPTPNKPAPAKEEKSATVSDKSYTKEELMEMESKELVKICKEEFGINPDDFDGKNTNKKLRDLILNAQKDDGAKKGDDTEEEKPAKGEDPDDGGDNSELTDQVAEILEDFDAGKKNKKKAISAICGLVDDADEDAVTELVEKFEDDADADLDEMAEEIAKVLNGEKEEKPAPKKSPKRSPKKKDEDLVAPEDLEVGDRVSVWWDDDNQEWFDGEVKSIKKGKVTIAYDDDTEEVIDPEVHTKIKRLAE